MRRLVIAIDCDDVLVPTSEFIVDAYNKKYGTQATVGQKETDSVEIWGAEDDEVVRRWAQLVETEGYKELGVDPGEAAILRRLAKHHELHLVTARQPHEQAFTEEVLHRDIPGVFTEMNFVGWTGSKGEVCERIGADVLIDDSVRHLTDALEHGVKPGNVVLFGMYPWNDDKYGIAGFRYASNWSAVEAIIESIAKE